LKPHEETYYGFQGRARDLTDETVLRASCESVAPWYARRLGPFLPQNRNARILDIPCGHGNMLYFLRRQGYRNVTGYDRDAGQVRLACSLELHAEQGEAIEVLSSLEQSFDCITSLDFLEHLSRDDALEALRLFRGRLVPGGVLILRTPCADGPFGAHDRYNDLTHVWAMTTNVLRTILKMLDFERVEIFDERPQPYNVVNALRWILFFPAKWLASGLCLGLGLTPPAVWSRSMWAVAHRPRESA
jgi:2-polyprenyl-3-methyl-5-hydroxy-6-metoxy-1,4-benzoquinol methylase